MAVLHDGGKSKMINLLMAVLITVLPTPDQVRASIARADSLRDVACQQLLDGELRPDFVTRVVKARIWDEIKEDFEEAPESSGFITIPMGHATIDGSEIEPKISVNDLIEILLRKELKQSGWHLKVWDCVGLKEFAKKRDGWLFRWEIAPKKD